ncbi:MAG: tRNA (adenosine(37)-N6)-threonylcarbamoyltransferase complex dimerization subunit type 1 TsaB [Anaerolineaceae bacterium]
MLLAVDTSTKTMGVALYTETGVLGEMIWQSDNYHTVELAPAIEQLLHRCEKRPADLQALAAAVGPGSFTGIRIGLAVIKGMALGLKIPIVGISSLDVVAAAQPVVNADLAAVLHAGRGRLAVGWYTAEDGAWKAQGSLEVLAADELVKRITKRTVISGELTAEEQRILARRYRNVVLASPAFAIRRPSFLAELAWKRWQNGDTDDPAALAPLYLHSGEEIGA